MKSNLLILVVGALLLLASSCSLSSHSMKTPENYIEFSKGDFEYTDQVSGEATEVKILGIDWARLFERKMGEIGETGTIDIPIIGSFIGRRVNTYAVYNMIKDNPGYDLVLYPQFETHMNRVFIVKVTKVKVTARLGKLKK
jgi:hypothetical protein